MRPASNMEELVKKLRYKASAAAHERVFGNVLGALDKSEKKRAAAVQPNMWRMIVKSKITKLAATAVITIGVLVAVDYFGLAVKMTAPAFADTIEEISKAHSVTYNWTIYGEDKLLSTSEQMVNEYGVTRYVLPHGVVMVYDRNSGKSLQLTPQLEKAVITYRVGREDKPKGLINYLEWLSNLHEESGQFEEQEEIDGKIAHVFVVERDFRKTTIWVDPETNLPVRVELVSLPAGGDIIVPKMTLHERDFGGEGNDSRTITITGNGVQGRRTIIWSDFVWNPELDDSLFSLEPPEDYSVEEIMFDVSDRGEDGLIDALAFWTEMSGGLFPSSINELGDPNKVRPMLIEKFDGEGDPKQEFDQAVHQMNLIMKGLWFAQKCKVEDNWYYAGDKVRLGESDRPVCWWESEDSDAFRAIYGDLSLADSNEAPQVKAEE